MPVRRRSPLFAATLACALLLPGTSRAQGGLSDPSGGGQCVPAPRTETTRASDLRAIAAGVLRDLLAGMRAALAPAPAPAPGAMLRAGVRPRHATTGRSR